MVTNKRSKFSRNRGSWTHGGGSKKKRRGAGHRGGRGMAGSGKRSDTKKPQTVWRNKKYFGKYGFKVKNQRVINPVNIEYLDRSVDSFVADGKVKKEGDVYVIDLALLGFNKLLSKGNTKKKFKITTEFSSASAVEKIKAAGGDVSVANPSRDEEEFVEDSEDTKKEEDQSAEEAA